MDDNVCCLEDGRFEVDPKSYIQVSHSSPPQQEGYTNSILNSDLLIRFLPFCGSSRPYHRASLRIAALYFIVDALSYSVGDEGSTMLEGAVETLDFGGGSLGGREESLK
jgi:hypothetical protein